jgi:hypothetical protein
MWSFSTRLLLAASFSLALASCCPPFCRPPKVRCVDFGPPPALLTEYGTPVGQSPGAPAFTQSGIPVFVDTFQWGGGGTTFGSARIEAASAGFGTGQVIRVNNINLEFDLAAAPGPVVTFAFLDLGGIENLTVNGIRHLGEFTTAPTSLGGVTVSVAVTPVPGGKRGKVTLTGNVQKLGIGGQELWLDDVCVGETSSPPR